MSTLASKKRSSIVAMIALVAFFGLVSQTIGQFAVFSGYGYGDDGCSGDAPKRLTISRAKNKKNITFRWSKVTFENCASETPASYELEIKPVKGSAETVTVTGITANKYTMSVSALETNYGYQFHVRAVAVDDTKTDYSKYKTFRTVPRRPGFIKITKSEDPTTVEASWKNIPRSAAMEYYYVVLKKDDFVVATAKVKKGLKKERARITISGLATNAKYTMTVQGVYSEKLKSRIQTRSFRTDK